KRARPEACQVRKWRRGSLEDRQMRRATGLLGIVAGVGSACFGMWLLVFTYACSTIMSPANRDTEYWTTVIGNMTTGGLLGTLLGLTFLVSGAWLVWLSCRLRGSDDTKG